MAGVLDNCDAQHALSRGRECLTEKRAENVCVRRGGMCHIYICNICNKTHAQNEFNNARVTEATQEQEQQPLKHRLDIVQYSS